jgi:DNA-binding PadR family transcriptional regulator
MLLLKIIAGEPINGFSIRVRLKQVPGDVLQVSAGPLHPALHKREQEGWLKGEWKMREKQPDGEIVVVDQGWAKTTGKGGTELESPPAAV